MKVLKLVPLVAALLCVGANAGEPSTGDLKATSSAATEAGAGVFQHGGMFDLYARNRADGIPNLITADFLLLGYSQLRQARITETEEQLLQPAFEQLLLLLQQDMQGAERGEPVSPDSVAFVALLQALLDGDATELPDPFKAEFDLIASGAGIEQSPVWNCAMDYSQFVPRGRYTESPQSEAYFRAFKYASSALFAFQPSAATGVDDERAERNAQLAVEFAAMLAKPGIAELYQQLIAQIEWNFGRSEDMRVEDLLQPAGDGHASAESLVQVAERNARIPDILSGVVDISKLEPGLSPSAALVGWRFLPASYSASAAAFQQLVFESGDELLLDCDSCESPPASASVVQGKLVKGYPSYLELMSMLGSAEADAHIDAQQLNRYTAYDSSRAGALRELADAAGLEQRENQIMQAIFNSSLPASEALSGAAGFWAWQKYLNILYQKQSYSVIGKGLGIQKPQSRDGAWLVPATGVYRALADLIDAQMGHDASERWVSLKAIVDQCIEISTRIELGLSPSPAQQAFLNDADSALKAIGAGADAPIVVDLHTNAADSSVLELGIGKPVIRMHERARGAGFSISEFTVPIDQRLDDNGWRDMLANDSAG